MILFRNIIIGVSFLAGITGLILSLVNIEHNKQVYVDMGKLYDEFHLSKQLNGDLEKIVKSRSKTLDSLLQDIQLKTLDLKQKLKPTQEELNHVAKLEELYYYKQQEFEKNNQTVSADYNTKIWNQINQYLQDFGKENKYTFIFGANGQGTIMFADDTRDITNIALAYVNDRFNGVINK